MAFLKKEATVIFLLTALLIGGCDNNDSSHNSSYSNPSDSTTILEDSFNETTDDFPDYYSDMGDNEVLYVWKNDNGFYRCGVRSSGSSITPTLGFFDKIQNESPCPLPIMKDIIKEKCDQQKIYIYEIDYPLSEQCYTELLSIPYPRFTSLNKEIYRQLDILDTYDYFFPNGNEYKDLSSYFTQSDTYAIKSYSKFFTETSYIYCWENNSGDYYYGISCEDNRNCVFYTWVDYMQNFFPCNKDEIKRIVQLFYQHNSFSKQNLIVKIPMINGYSQYQDDLLAIYPANLDIINDELAYEELGLLDTFNSLNKGS